MDYAVKTVARSAALLVGVACTGAVAFVTWHDAVHHQSALLFTWCILLLPAIPLAIIWRKDLYADPMILPASLLGFCTFVCSIIAALEMYEPGLLQRALSQPPADELPPTHRSVWLKVMCSLLATAGLQFARFVYTGSLASLHVMIPPKAGTTRRAT